MNKNRFWVWAASIISVALLIAITGLAFAGQLILAIRILAAASILAGLSRVLWRGDDAWFAAKQWWIDALFFLLVGIGLLLLSPYALVAVGS
ncbi:hypothetical protein BK816_06685 [Boudabousia tangfeifanii]|uniref:DUF3017 domain-containing protein n=1 Tax=Boudabousia tangfeifanii TaxID=1912795 RepID=A0A1D9MLG3_9ACTO|nr:hypothetical protein [Boudabousia tangfeifanii]AOZ73013.1 hypothetical protein BK816_06685 [Boudabousia tangfeifanii]